MRTWDGGTLLPCKKCGADDWESGEDHYGGIGDNYERYTCGQCGNRIKIELPDG